VAEMLKKAQAVLGYDLLKLCLEGPKEQLDETRCTTADAGHLWARSWCFQSNLLSHQQV
jgi:hypothetical protein